MNSERELLSPDVTITLSNCDLEPIHIPSFIQPHGLLLAARLPDLRIVYTSANSLEILGVAPPSVLTMTLTELLGIGAVTSIQDALKGEQYLPNNILLMNFAVAGSAKFDAVAHHSGNFLCVELELAEEQLRSDSIATRMEGAIRELGRAKTVNGLCSAFAPLVRSLTGYDRVMVYRFDRDGHGEIVAEAKDPEMEPYLGLHYPATDIPHQARRLYLAQRVRTIVDVGYRPVPVLANSGLSHGEPLDMTYCALRSISPLHIEYLQNMKVGATFAISLIHSNELWGMLLCHHRTAKHLSPAMRSFCDLLGQTASLLIEVTQHSEEYEEQLKRKALLETLRTALAAEESIGAAFNKNAVAVLALVNADGALLKLGVHLHLIGTSPPLVEAVAILEDLASQTGRATVSCSDEVLPAFQHLAKVASGHLMVSFKAPGDGLLWFRSEATETVRWAGKPEVLKETAEDGSVRLSPRKSFAKWEEVQKGRSLPWAAIDEEAALALQRIMAEKYLSKQLLSEQMLREKRIEALSHMAGGLAHEINNPLAIIHGTASNLKALAEGDSLLPSAEVRKASTTIVETSDRAMRILSGLRGFAREAANDPMEWASIYDIAEQSVELQEARFATHDVRMTLVLEPEIPLFLCRAVQIGQILTNLLNNAFDAITQHNCEERWISLNAFMMSGRLLIDVTDSGRGIDDETRANLMQPFFTTKTRGLGMGIGLSLSRAIAQGHGGDLSLADNTEHTSFRLSLPIEKEPSDSKEMKRGAY
jgi:light-regulated signal transduction histidine kinase (bacteriophytochrome)